MLVFGGVHIFSNIDSGSPCNETINIGVQVIYPFI